MGNRRRIEDGARPMHAVALFREQVPDGWEAAQAVRDLRLPVSEIPAVEYTSMPKRLALSAMDAGQLGAFYTLLRQHIDRMPDALAPSNSSGSGRSTVTARRSPGQEGLNAENAITTASRGTSCSWNTTCLISTTFTRCGETRVATLAATCWPGTTPWPTRDMQDGLQRLAAEVQRPPAQRGRHPDTIFEMC
jgi:hypothetical protein